MNAKHTHLLTIRDDDPSELDPHAVVLWLNSRGQHVLVGEVGDEVRANRDCLAGLLEEGALSDLLISFRPIRVSTIDYGYVIEEV